MDTKSALFKNAGVILLEVLALAALYLTSLDSYLLFHSLIELFTVIVAGGIFVIAWNARGYIHNNYILFIGIASVFVALIDVLHTLAYQGMGVFAGDTANLATQLWIAAQYLQAMAWLMAPLFLHRRLRLGVEVGAYALATGLLLLSIFYWKAFPVAFISGIGLTPFKVASEYIIASVLVAAMILLVREREEFDGRVWQFLLVSLALTIAAEMAFTSYVSVFGGANLVGHLARWLAFYYLYKAIIETGLVQPYTILLRDVQQSDQRLREYASALEARNANLVETENRLREEGAALQARNEELDAYAHTVAHDLKNPLAVIVATGDVINEVKDLSPKELREFLLQIKSTAFEMNTIVDSLLLLSEVRTVDAPLGPVDMAEVVREVQGRLGYLVEQQHGHLFVPKAWPTAIGYGPWIAEVWANYISNALKYGGPSPRVELGANIQPDGMIKFWTRDHGAGLSAEAQTSLFTPFTKLRKKRKGGHGLGLSIVLRIVQKLGGQVGVESKDGAGTEFFFTLPAAAETAPSKAGQASSRQAEAPA